VVTVHGGLYRTLSFGQQALFADPFDKEDLGTTMLKVFRHPELRRRMSRMGALKARGNFTWNGIAQQLIAAVEQRPARHSCVRMPIGVNQGRAAIEMPFAYRRPAQISLGSD
jgi:mannosylfructose-phosphate synthase